MAERKKIKQYLKKLQAIKTWQLIILFVLSVFVSLSLLRLNNLGMIERRQDVIEADKMDDRQLVLQKLTALQTYVSRHMNTDMGKGVYLEETYKRDVQQAYQKAASQENPNGNIYKKVQEICMPRFSGWSQAYVQCTVDELAKYPAAVDQPISLPKPNTYLHSYLSPVWSPDLAGWSVLLSVVILIIIISRFIGVVILKIILKKRYRTI